MSSYESRLWRAVTQALELEGTPYYMDAIEAIVELGYRQHEIEEDEFWDNVHALDPFIRACVYILIGIESPVHPDRKEGTNGST